LRLPLPQSLLVCYLVLGETAIADPDLTLSRSDAGLPAPAAAALRLHLGDLRVLPLDDLSEAPVPPTELLRAAGSSPTARRLVASARYGWSLLLRVPTRDGATGDTATRTAARVLAARASGVVVDTVLLRATTPDEQPERPCTSDLLRFEHQPRGFAWQVTTRGLTRFGLPELVAREVEARHVPACHALLVGVAHRMVTALPDVADADPAVMVIGLPLGLRLEDIAAGYGQPVADDPTAKQGSDLVLQLQPDDGTVLVDPVPAAVQDLFGDALPSG